jgi:hypothetical protein
MHAIPQEQTAQYGSAGAAKGKRPDREPGAGDDTAVKSKVAKPRGPPLEDPEILAYRVNAAARVSGLCRATLYNKIRSGELRSVMVAGRRLIPAPALRDFLLGSSENAAA